MPPRFIRRRFEHLLGESYEPEKVRQVFRELTETGMFEDLQIEPEPLEPGKMRLNVLMDEAKFQEFGLYGGFGSFDGYILGLSYQNRRFLKAGSSFRSEMEMN